MCKIDRWPVIYDFNDLVSQIKVIKNSSDEFYQTKVDQQSTFCQGDIISLNSPFPFIDEDGEIAIFQSTGLWVIIGNTCDIARSNNNLPYTQVAPLFEINDTDIDKDILNDLKDYQSFKKFYYQMIDGKHYILDFTQICTLDKSFLKSKVNKIKELSYSGWILLHCCLVRYFARDDGRDD